MPKERKNYSSASVDQVFSHEEWVLWTAKKRLSVTIAFLDLKFLLHNFFYNFAFLSSRKYLILSFVLP